jgi:ketosteroid isomerase-like protein
MKLFLTLLTTVTLLTASAQSKDEQTIRNLLARQNSDWNKGNIAGFMNGYWNNDSLLFVGKSGPNYGYRTTLQNYLKSYPDTTAMGKLHFDILKVQALSPDCYFVLGKWMLTRTIGNLSGHYTLILRKIKGKWVIVSDHSS